ncbi:bifunctional hydroxymethylpyrimidine kinase/phosphomethylpyrimidine kinase [Gordonia shandongensis]|uniref:bifunctional hydroxymethylpyrimidine kinase/phosphomethylpyrimidine kinase n=1 Tax=Gordonia shandongensis TaxID=376351 RepID=UPI00042A6329|nr:bifunctional hydroxymethylpyrimidine kinase/phosphomethylpyrimidine kinase [Gordonia shandongensis]
MTAAGVGTANGPSEIYTTAHASRFELDPRPADVLAVGSQLAYGSVGLNAALPVYADAGLRCAAVPSIVLSNLPHYRSVQSIDVAPEWITRTLRDLDATGALRRLRAVAVGYLASGAQAHAIADWYRGLDPATRPPLILDPTFGDADVGFYTDPRVAPALRAALLPLASIVTPNTFELTHLTAAPDGTVDPLPTFSSAPAAVTGRARELLRGPDMTIVVTGLDSTDSASTDSDTTDSDTTDSDTTDSDTTGTDDTGRDRPLIGNAIVTADDIRTIVGDEIATSAKGLGDTFAAALTAALLTGHATADAVEYAADRVRSAIGRGVPSEIPRTAT